MTISRDGKPLVGSAGRGQSSYPIAVASGGTVSELETYRTGGTALAIVAGDFYDSGASEQRGFLISGSSRFVIPELLAVVSVTPDGKYVAGSLRTGNEAGLGPSRPRASRRLV